MCLIWVISILNPSTQPVEVTLADFLIWLDGHPVNIFTLLPFGLWIIIQIGKTYWRGSMASMEGCQLGLFYGEDFTGEESVEFAWPGFPCEFDTRASSAILRLYDGGAGSDDELSVPPA